MSKPITIAYEEFKDNFASLVNDCGLPACMVESILESYLKEINVIAKRQYEIDKKRYEEAIEEQVGGDCYEQKWKKEKKRL